VTLQVVLGALGGALVTALTMWLLARRRRARRTAAGGDAVAAASESVEVDPRLPAAAADVLAVLSSTAIVLDRSEVVVSASPSAAAYGLVRRNGLVHEDIRRLVRQVRSDQVIRAEVLHVSRGWTDRAPAGSEDRIILGVRVAPLGVRHILVL